LLGVSRSTLSRTVRAAGRQVVVRGTARRTAYGLRRPLRGSDRPLPQYRVDHQGKLHRIGEIDLVSPTGIAVRWEDAATFEWPLEPAMREGWTAAARAAITFWSACAADTRISSPFRKTCEANARQLSAVLG